MLALRGPLSRAGVWRPEHLHDLGKLLFAFSTFWAYFGRHERVAAEPRLEPLGSELSISCFRYVPEGWSDGEALNGLNRRILETLNAEGQVYMSPTTLDGRYSLRVAIVNFRTAASDVDFLVDEVLRLGGDFPNW